MTPSLATSAGGAALRRLAAAALALVLGAAPLGADPGTEPTSAPGPGAGAKAADAAPAAPASGAGAAPEAAGTKPPVVLISLDTLRADHVGAYGYERETTPHLDRFAGDAVLFEDAFTTGGGTLPAHMTLLTSLAPATHGVNTLTRIELAGRHRTLAEILGGAGYRTAAFTGGGYVRREFGFDQGFEVFDDAGPGFDEILPKATEWLDREDERPPFLFLHTLDVHSDWERLPYDAPPPFRDRFVAEDYSGSFDGCRSDRCASELFAWLNQEARRGDVDLESYFTPEELRYVTDLYDGGVAHADARFGDLVEALRTRGLWDDAVVVVVSDHGEELLEHGLLLHEQAYEEVVRVPLLVKLPGGRRGGTRAAGLVSMADVLPTILDAAGIEKQAGLEGVSLLPMTEGRSGGRGSVYLFGNPEKLRTPKWSLLRWKDGATELYDVSEDPEEKNDLAASRKNVVEALSNQLDAQGAARAAAPGRSRARGKPVELAPEVVDRLEALGYLQD